MILLAHRTPRPAPFRRILQSLVWPPRRVPHLPHLPDHLMRDVGLMDGQCYPGRDINAASSHADRLQR